LEIQGGEKSRDFGTCKTPQKSRKKAATDLVRVIRDRGRGRRGDLGYEKKRTEFPLRIWVYKKVFKGRRAGFKERFFGGGERKLTSFASKRRERS